MKAKTVSIFLLSLVVVGCSTNRNTYVSRKYHDLTAYYNVYFNGRESMRQASKKLEAIESQNFDEILPVFAFEYEEASGLVAGEMQRTIDKGAKTVEKHSITVKPKRKKNMTKEQREFYNKKEFNHFVDDAHLIVGKANAYLHEYDVAEEKFAFIETEYAKETSVYEAQAWQAIVLSHEKQYVKAEDLLTSLTRKKEIPRRVEPLIDEAFADLYIKQNKYQEAIPHLEKALKRAKGKNKKIRYNFILGQLYQKTNNNSKATEYFSKVLKKNPPYLTAFNAEMAMAYTYDPETQKGNLRRILEKALKSEQNANYHDQIYYAFAKLEEREGNIPESLEYYRKSTTATGVNTRQKGQSYLALAEYYIQKNDYINAYTCYDSSAIMLGANHSLFEEVSAKANKYRKLALNMKIVEREDSLQKLAGLSKDDLEKLVAEKIKQAENDKKRTEEEKARLEKLKADIDAQSSQGQWYFYNPNSLELGKTDFAMRWGQRKLEDNWRRKNRGIQAQTGYDFDLEEEEKIDVIQSDTIDKDAIIANIPQTDEAKKASNEKIVSAMFNIGEAYRDDLTDLAKAAEALENLNRRFPSHNLLPESYVALYEIYTKTGDNNKALYYKNLMLQNYPDNPKFLAATDPGYINRIKAQEASEEADYYTAMNYYTSNRLGDTYNASLSGLSKYPKGRLIPQFTLLKTLSDNYNGDVSKYRTALEDIVQKYPGNVAASYAKDVLKNLEKSELELITKTKQTAATPSPMEKAEIKTGAKAETKTEQKPEAKPEAKTEAKTEAVQETKLLFKPQVASSLKSRYSSEDGVHAFVVITDANVNVNRLRFNILSFNSVNFLEANYEVQIVDFADNKMLIMDKIKDRNAAIEFFNKISNDKKAFSNLSINDYVSFIILESNLKLIRSGTSFLDYVEFFNKVFLE
ncbi:MAG: tetratricopeptide repeat protein [Prevotellaceae bacterium]|jgi:tetratricopeptide (TPR) repeat protein|nr:tetratricopeptide repeat protein [Prevotellaceae bacterium]